MRVWRGSVRGGWIMLGGLPMSCEQRGGHSTRGEKRLQREPCTGSAKTMAVTASCCEARLMQDKQTGGGEKNDLNRDTVDMLVSKPPGAG